MTTIKTPLGPLEDCDEIPFEYLVRDDMVEEIPPEYMVLGDKLLPCEYLPDPMIDHYEPPTMTAPMGWGETMEWLRENEFRVWIWPSEMNGGCTASESAELIEDMVTEPGERDPKCLIVEVGINACDREVAWVYPADTPMEEWHRYQRGCTFYREPWSDPDAPPDELPYAFWPHIALCVR
jgi:hypothetical protein